MPRKKRQRRYDPLAVLSYIASYKQRLEQRSPSERRIKAALNISAPSVVHTIVRRLERAELLVVIRYGRGQGSDLMLTEAGQDAVRRWQQERSATDETTPTQEK